MLMPSRQKIESITNKFPHEITTKRRTHHDPIFNMNSQLKREAYLNQIQQSVWPPISTPKHGKISYSKGAK